MNTNRLYDVAVIGGGPAGMMAALTAVQQGVSVVLIEKNEKLGKKLLITGGGRCNITNATFDNRALAQKYGPKGKFLLSPLSQWSAQDTISFFEKLGVPTKTENESRVFPESNSAQTVWDVLVRKLKDHNVTILTKTPVTEILRTKTTIRGVETTRGVIYAKQYIIATGGTARPETGSSGEGFLWLKKLGHTIGRSDSALVPIKIGEPWVKNLQGLAFPKVKLTLSENGVLRNSQTGKILFTHFGISGPLVLNMSRTIGEAMRESKVLLHLDLFPLLDHRALDEKFLEHLKVVQNKKWQNALKGFLPALFTPYALSISGIDLEIEVNKIPRVARIAFIKKLKELTLTPTGLLGTDKAIVSSGGVTLEEIDFKTMRSQKITNLYITGDVLDFNRPSGGFSLQICWTTGFIAGKSAAIKSKERVS